MRSCARLTCVAAENAAVISSSTRWRTGEKRLSRIINLSSFMSTVSRLLIYIQNIKKLQLIEKINFKKVFINSK